MKHSAQAVLIVTVLAVSQPSLAQGYRLVAGGGAIDSRNSSNETFASLEVEGPEYASLWQVRPTLNVLVSHQDTHYVGLGLVRDFQLSNRWQLGLGWSVGYYETDSPELTLGHETEFMTRAWLGYQLDSRNTLRVQLGHLSNADLGDENPGTETLSVHWAYRL